MDVAGKMPAISQIKICMKPVRFTVCFHDTLMRQSLPPINTAAFYVSTVEKKELGRDTSRFPSADVTLLDRHLLCIMVTLLNSH